jgi:propionate CoA-transferase
MDFAAAARTLVFVAGWMRGGALEVRDDALRVRRRGAPKFVARVAEVTFPAKRALEAGKRVFYVTPLGVFRLGERGIELVCVVPGVDVRRDVLDATPIDLVLPASGEVPRAAPGIVSGRDFRLPTWAGGRARRSPRRKRPGA